MTDKFDWGKLPDQKDPNFLSNPYQRIEELCVKVSKKDFDEIFKEGKSFANDSQFIEEKIEQFQRNSSSISLFSIILLWAQLIVKDSVLGEKRLTVLAELIEAGFFFRYHD